MNKKILGILALGAFIATASLGVAYSNVLARDNKVDLIQEDMGNGGYAIEVYEDSLDSQEDLENLKDEFTKEYGNEDVFKKIYEDDEYIEEVNGAKGIFRYTDKITNEVEEYNYFEELEKEFEFSKLSSDEKIKAMKDEFTKEYGNEDVFKKIYEDDEYIEEVNGAKGIFRYTDKITNEVEEENYFESLSNSIIENE